MNKKSQSVVRKKIHFYRLFTFASIYGKYFKGYGLLSYLLFETYTSILGFCFEEPGKNFRDTDVSFTKGMDSIAKKFDLFLQKETIKNNNTFFRFSKLYNNF